MQGICSSSNLVRDLGFVVDVMTSSSISEHFHETPGFSFSSAFKLHSKIFQIGLVVYDIEHFLKLSDCFMNKRLKILLVMFLHCFSLFSFNLDVRC